MLSSFFKLFSIAELKEKILFTFLMLVVCRIGAFIPVPGINGQEVLFAFQTMTGEGNNLFALVDVFSGGAFSQMTVIALGVMPYISASIIVQLLTIMFPSLQREMREMPELGKRKLLKWTRLFTLLLAAFQAAAFSLYALHLNESHPGIIATELLHHTFFQIPLFFYCIVIATMTTGTLFLMWLGEQITEKGIGNGISLIIALNILVSFPGAIKALIRQLHLESQERGEFSFVHLSLLIAIFIGVIISTILINKGERKIPLQYARRIVGRREMQGAGASYLPLKVNYAGVIPVIFASALLMFPATITRFLGQGSFVNWISHHFSPNSWTYVICYAILIIFFTYFWTATQFQPQQIASEMKRGGAFIPGIKQGKATQKYLEDTMSNVTCIGAFSLAFIATFPVIIGKVLHIDPAIRSFFGGTSLLILVGVVLDTIQQISSHLLSKKYDRVMKRGKAWA